VTELRQASQTATSIMTVTFRPLVTAARMKSGERQTPVGGKFAPLEVRGVFSITKLAYFKHNNKTCMGIIAVAIGWKNSGIIQYLSIIDSSLS